MLTKVSIKGFRGLNVEADLKKINVIVGKNGTGKTSFLEAIFLSSLFYSKYTESEIEALTLYALSSRGNALSSYLAIENAEVSMWDDNEELKVIYRREEPYTLNVFYPEKLIATLTLEHSKVPYGESTPSYTLRVKLKQKELRQRVFPVYLSTRFDSVGIPEKVISYARYKGIKSNFEILQDQYGSYTLHYTIDNMVIPVYLIGRGLLKEELMKDSLSFASLTLIDEIEDSLHPDMIIRVLKIMEKSKSQVIFSTHSNDVMEFMTNIFEDNEVNIIYLSREGYKVYTKLSLFKGLEKPLSWVGYL